MNNDTNHYKIQITGRAVNALMCQLLTFPVPPGPSLNKVSEGSVKDVGSEIQPRVSLHLWLLGRQREQEREGKKMSDL